MTILDDIDATLDNRCAGCRNPLPTDSPSAWFCGENCQARWHHDRAGNPPLLHDTSTPTPSTIRIRADFGSWYRGSEDAIAALDGFFAFTTEPEDTHPQPGARLVFVEDLDDPEHPTAAELAAGIPIGTAAGDGITIAPPQRGRLASAWARIRTTIGGTR